MHIRKSTVSAASALLTGALLAVSAAAQQPEGRGNPKSDTTSPSPSAAQQRDCERLNPVDRADCERRTREGGSTASSTTDQRPTQQSGWGRERDGSMTEGERNREQMRGERGAQSGADQSSTAERRESASPGATDRTRLTRRGEASDSQGSTERSKSQASSSQGAASQSSSSTQSTSSADATSDPRRTRDSAEQKSSTRPPQNADEDDNSSTDTSSPR